MTDAPTCRRCGGAMRPGWALEQTFVTGEPDFPGDDHVSTYSAGGPGKVVDCIKCEGCGHSVAGGPDMPEVIWADKFSGCASDGTWTADCHYNTSWPPYILQSTHEAELAEKDARIAELEDAMGDALHDWSLGAAGEGFDTIRSALAAERGEG